MSRIVCHKNLLGTSEVVDIIMLNRFREVFLYLQNYLLCAMKSGVSSSLIKISAMLVLNHRENSLRL